VDTAGDVIHYTVKVESIGVTNLTGITVVDPDVPLTYQSGDLDSDGVLDVGEVWIYIGSYTVSQAEINAGEPIHDEVTADSLETSPDSFEIDVAVVNSTPIAIADEYDLHWSDSSLSVGAVNGVLANDSDANSNPLTSVLGATVSHGSLTLKTDGSFIYTPAIDFNGPTDSFTYRAYDGIAYSDLVTVTIEFTNTPPAGISDEYSTKASTQLIVAAPSGVLVNDDDSDGDSLIAEIYENPAAGQGILTLQADGSFVFTPDDGFGGDATFTYRVFDGLEYSNPVVVTIHVAIRAYYLPMIANDYRPGFTYYLPMINR
jgi:VCBS repeat-containing protein